MTLSAEATDRQRVRAALVVLGAGLLLVLFALLLLMIDPVPESPPLKSGPPVNAEQHLSEARTLTSILIVAGLLFMLFLIVGYAFIRGSRGYQRRLAARRTAATPTDSVWAMHKLPESPEEPEAPPAAPSAPPTS